VEGYGKNHGFAKRVPIKQLIRASRKDVDEDEETIRNEMKIEGLGARTVHRVARVAVKMESRDGSGRGSREHGVCR